MSPTLNDPRTEAAIKAAIEALYGASVDRVNVRAGKDYDDEPAIFVTVFMKPGQKRMSGSDLLDSIAAASAALRGLQDDRFPYVIFRSPEDESAEDARPAA